MVGDLYETLLGELAKALDMKELKPDSNNTCLIHFENGVEVYIEPFEKGDALLMISDLGHVPPGRYREDVFREALKANGQPWPRHGVFAYSDQSDHLLLFKLMTYEEINGEKVADYLTLFLDKAAKWRESLERGEVPVVDTFTTSRRSGPKSMFGGLT